MSKTFTVAEVGKHKDEKEGIYIIVDGSVYDITSECIQVQPGGAEKAHLTQTSRPESAVRTLEESLALTPCPRRQTSWTSTQAARRSSSAWRARTPRSRSGSITTRRCWPSTGPSSRSERWRKRQNYDDGVGGREMERGTRRENGLVGLVVVGLYRRRGIGVGVALGVWCVVNHRVGGVFVRADSCA